MDRRSGAVALLVALAAGAAALALTLMSPHEELRAVGYPDSPIMGPLIGWSFAGAGLVASYLRPENRFGRLMYATGLAWFLSALITSGSPLLFTVGELVAPLWLGLFLHALLAFPTGRLEGRGRVFLVGLFYVDVVVIQAVWVLFSRSEGVTGCQGCPRNLLLVADRPDVAAAVLLLEQPVLGSVAIGGTLVLLVHQWWVASAPQRRVLGPVLVTGASCLFVLAVTLVAEPFSYSAGQAVGWLGAFAFTAVPLAFLAGLLRQRLDRSAVGQLVTELGALHGGGNVDGLLRKALRDPSLQVAYWRYETDEYVDLAGRPVRLPAPESDRTVTVVERDGRRIAALMHDVSVTADSALVSGVVAAAGLALENERLSAEVRAQLEELRASRRRLVEAGDRERRRLERNLHDGAQQRLLAVSLLLTRLERSAADVHPDPDVLREMRDIATTARAELSRSLSELRDLALGLHPVMLNDHGLAVALEDVLARVPIPVDVSVVLAHRPPIQVEVAAYYVICEALANMVKHAQAHRAQVCVRDEGSSLHIEVVDDGIGGAASSAGSGLQGLTDRLGALDGRLVVVSPPGAGTALHAVIPCG
jgi:signal transduction histidine kinase